MSAEETVFVSETCIGEVCWCGEPAVRKVGEEFAYDEPNPQRHNLTRYICAHHYAELMGPLGAKHVGLPPPTPTEAAALWGCADGNGVDPRLIFRDRATAEQVAAGLGLTVQPLYTHPAPIKPSGDTGELRERVARIVDPSAFLFSRDELDAKVRHHPHDAAYAIADAILSLIQSERAG